MSTGTGRARWMRRQTSSPSRPGSMRSRTTRSGARRSHASTPAGPSAAMSTANPSLRSRSATASAIVGSSSMTRIDRDDVTVGPAKGREGSDTGIHATECLCASPAGRVEIPCRPRCGAGGAAQHGAMASDQADRGARYEPDGGGGPGFGRLADPDRHFQHVAGVGAHPDPEVVAPEGAVDDGDGDRAVESEAEVVGPDREEAAVRPGETGGEVAGPNRGEPADRGGDFVAENLGDERVRGRLPHRGGSRV